MQDALIQKLVADRAERTSKITTAKAQIASWESEAKAIETVVLIYDPQHRFETAATSAKARVVLFERGELQRMIVAFVKSSDTVVATKDITRHVAGEKGIEASGIKKLSMSVASALSAMKKNDILAVVQKDGATHWKIAGR